MFYLNSKLVIFFLRLACSSVIQSKRTFLISRTLNFYSFYSRSSFNTEFISGVSPFLDLWSWCTSTLSGLHMSHSCQSVNLLPGASLRSTQNFNGISWLEVKRRQPHEEPLFTGEQLMSVVMRGSSSSELGGLSSAWVIWSQSLPIYNHREPWAGLTKAEPQEWAAKCQISEQLCLARRNTIFSLYLNMPYLL